jgi:hypothetical protein
MVACGDIIARYAAGKNIIQQRRWRCRGIYIDALVSTRNDRASGMTNKLSQTRFSSDIF